MVPIFSCSMAELSKPTETGTPVSSDRFELPASFCLLRQSNSFLEGTMRQGRWTTINLKLLAAWLSDACCELRSFGLLFSPEPALFIVLALAATLLASGCGTNPQAPKENPQPTVVTRTWTFEKFTNGNNEAVPIGEPRSQIAGVVNDRAEL